MGWEAVLEVDGGDACTAVWVYLLTATELFALKLLKQ